MSKMNTKKTRFHILPGVPIRPLQNATFNLLYSTENWDRSTSGSTASVRGETRKNLHSDGWTVAMLNLKKEWINEWMYEWIEGRARSCSGSCRKSTFSIEWEQNYVWAWRAVILEEEFELRPIKHLTKLLRRQWEKGAVAARNRDLPHEKLQKKERRRESKTKAPSASTKWSGDVCMAPLDVKSKRDP